MSRPHPILVALRASERRVAAGDGMRVSLGTADVDARLGGGIARAALHELFAASAEDASAAAGFAVLLAIRAGLGANPLLWVREDRGERMGGRLNAPGLAELGIDPDRVLTVHAPDALAVLRAGNDIVKCPGVGAVVIEPAGKAPALDLTASRRLALSAARSGVFTLLLRTDALPMPSAAATRWSIASAPSTALEADAPGAPAFDIALLRHRGGLPGFSARLEWNRDEQFFRAPLSGGAPAAALLRTGEAAAHAA